MTEGTDPATWLDIKTRFILKEGIDVDNRVITITGEITKQTYVRFDKQLRLLENVDDSDVTVIINSNGGNVYEAFAIIDRIKGGTCTVNTEAVGMIASAALPIFLAGSFRSCGAHTTFMHHSMSYGTGFDNVPTHEGELKHSKRLDNLFNKYIASRTLKPYSFWANTGKHVDYYFTSEEAIEWGVVSDIF